MLTASVVAMLAALCLGLWLSVRVLLQDGPGQPAPVTGLLHAGAGIATVVCLFLALGGPRRGVATGASGFGWIAFVLLCITLSAGALIAATRLRRLTPSVMLVAGHATLGIAGIVILAAWWAAPAASGH